MSDTFDTDGQDEGNSNEYKQEDSAKKTIIPANLLKDVNDLLSGAKIVKIENDVQCDNIVALGKTAKALRIETEKTGKVNIDPLYKTYKDAQSFVADKVDALKAIEKNVADVTGKYQFDKQEFARKEQLRLIEEARQKQIALADAQNARIADEEALREEALAKLADADALLAELEKIQIEAAAKKESMLNLSNTTSHDVVAQGAELLVMQREVESLRRSYAAMQAKRNALIAESNTANTVADIAIEEAKEIETAIINTAPEVAAPAYSTPGLSLKKKLAATITDYRAVLKWIVDNGEWGLIEGAAFRSMVDAGAKKYCANLADKSAFKMAGAICKEEVSGRF